MLNETAEKFLRSILERVPLERVVELHLFPAIRQGPIETGVAVVAAEPAPLALAETLAGAEAEPASEFERHAPRLEVHTAWYRLTRKGPERGKWEFEVKTQADAPLETIEMVVRGVQERAGEAIEPTRLTNRELVTLT